MTKIRHKPTGSPRGKSLPAVRKSISSATLGRLRLQVLRIQVLEEDWHC